MQTAPANHDDEPWKPLQVGVVFGGRSDGVVAAEICRLRECVDRAIERLAPSDTGQADVLVQFHLPGDVVSPDFEGMRIGSWIGKQRCQIIQVALPANLRDPADVVEFLAWNLERAVRLAGKQIRFRRSSVLSTSQASIVASVAASELRPTNP
jgi:hypothetical protein